MRMRDVSAAAAETGRMETLLPRRVAGLDEFVRFGHPDALHDAPRWRDPLSPAIALTPA